MTFFPRERTKLSAVISGDTKSPTADAVLHDGIHHGMHDACKYDLTELMSEGDDRPSRSAGTTQAYQSLPGAYAGYCTASTGFASDAIPRVVIVRRKTISDKLTLLLQLYSHSEGPSTGWGPFTARLIQPQNLELGWLQETAEMTLSSIQDTSGIAAWLWKHSTSARECKITFTDASDGTEKTVTMAAPLDLSVVAPAYTNNYFEVGLRSNGAQSDYTRLIKFQLLTRRRAESGVPES